MPANGQNNGPQALLNACRLWERTSAKGNRYLTGRLGGLRVLIMENTRPAEGDDSTHTLFFGEAAKKAAPRADEGRQTEGRQATGGAARQPQQRSKVHMPDGDEVPFWLA